MAFAILRCVIRSTACPSIWIVNPSLYAPVSGGIGTLHREWSETGQGPQAHADLQRLPLLARSMALLSHRLRTGSEHGFKGQDVDEAGQGRQATGTCP